MSHIDPRLKFLQSQKKRELGNLEGTGRFALESVREGRATRTRAKVLVKHTGKPEALKDAGLEVCSVAGDLVSGIIDLTDVDALSKVKSVLQIESSRPMHRELDVSMPEILADQVHTGPPGLRGEGVIIGIIDSGIDFTHGCFRAPDGSTRILAIWDQSLNPQGTESSPSGFTYGVEYTAADIDAALATATPTNTVRHVDRDPINGHGTHVAGIAAGDGSVADTDPAFTFVGVAPEADIIVVANAVATAALGDSAQTLDAVNYIFNKANALGRPVVINESQGDNIGPHDGTSLLEQGIDNLLGGAGRSMVKSAGNEGSRRRHAMGTVPSGGNETVQFSIPTGDSAPDVIDIWYDGADRFGFSITPPGGVASAVVNPGTTTTLNLPNGNSIFVDSSLNDPNNGDNRIYVTLQPGTAPGGAIQAGTWSFTLQGQTVVDGGFHAWAERGTRVPTFLGAHQTNSHTISIPGTAQEVIPTASYITAGAGAGNISGFSSRGPTRDGRDAPFIAAPGQAITSARAPGSSNGSGQYHAISGTSMAAPHIAGVIALMFEKNGTLTQQQIRDCLANTARSDVFTGATPNATWGAGKVDALAAVNCVPGLVTIKWTDDPITINKLVDDPRTPNKALDDPRTINKFQDDPRTLKTADDPRTINKALDDPRTINKFLDDPRTLKTADDPRTINKALDDPRTINKFQDDPRTLKTADDPRTVNKFQDDPQTPNKAVDDPLTFNKFADDGGGGTLKPVDDPVGGGTDPRIDPVKQPGLDKNPAGDLGGPKFAGADGGFPGAPGRPAGGASPFVLATPHHSMAWAESYPEAYAQELARYEATIAEYEAALSEYAQAAEARGLSPEAQQQFDALDLEYQAVLAEYEQLQQAGMQ